MTFFNLFFFSLVLTNYTEREWQKNLNSLQNASPDHANLPMLAATFRDVLVEVQVHCAYGHTFSTRAWRWRSINEFSICPLFTIVLDSKRPFFLSLPRYWPRITKEIFRQLISVQTHVYILRDCHTLFSY